MSQPTNDEHDAPWDELRDALEDSDPNRLHDVLEELPETEVPRAMAHLSEETQARVLATLPASEAAGLLEELPPAQAAGALQHVDAEQAALILHELRSDERADFIASFELADAEAVLDRLAPEEADEVRELSGYDAKTVGGLMFKEYLSFKRDQDVAGVVDHLRSHAEAYARYDVQYGYVINAKGQLVGVLQMRDLLLSAPGTQVGEIMIEGPLALNASEGIAEAGDRFEGRSFLALPVVDDQQQLLGVVQRYRVEEALADRAEADHLKSVGIVGGEELRSMPLRHRASRRLSWLSINIVLNVLAASVIALFEETLAAVIALAIFLPIISDMSGCSGNQAVAVSIRELSLGLIRPLDLGWVWLKEAGVGLINGVVLGGLIGVIAFLWKGNAWLGLVVGLALFVNTLIAVSIGGGVPLVLKRFGVDPALASGPVLTTTTDICGFLLVLGLATLWLPQLTGG